MLCVLAFSFNFTLFVSRLARTYSRPLWVYFQLIIFNCEVGSRLEHLTIFYRIPKEQDQVEGGLWSSDLSFNYFLPPFRN